MATESFDKEFILNTQEQVDAFIKAIEEFENRKKHNIKTDAVDIDTFIKHLDSLED
jgi:hypothetical protein